ncbi:short-chain dehydrogenase/reductase SDR [Umbelopsis sp. AD052]|jgi:3-oxoacyl-[acyl-carrier protein] reductase|nr:short-chain dehydrogenase/reductase SDR [Umbelopsis sp. AD052]
MQARPLEGKVAIVTGGTRGIGEAIVNALSDQGASIVVNYTSSEDRAEAIVKRIEADGGKAISVQADIGNVNAAKKIVKATVEAFGKIDIVVNNAAIGIFQVLEEIQVEDFVAMFNVNVRGPILLVKESSPYLQEYGRIINISSVAARNGFHGAAVYAGTKGALESISRVWATEFGGKNITSNCVNPGPVATDAVLQQPPEYVEAFKQVTQNAAIKRFATPKEIADVVAFLAGPGSQWITGDVLNANGGLIFT